jgi:hypothetical protein
VRAGTRVSVTTWAVCTNTKEPGDGSAESAHRKPFDSPCAQVTGRASTLWKGDPSKPRLSRGFSLQAIWGSDALFQARVISRPSSVGTTDRLLRCLVFAHVRRPLRATSRSLQSGALPHQFAIDRRLSRLTVGSISYARRMRGCLPLSGVTLLSSAIPSVGKCARMVSAT